MEPLRSHDPAAVGPYRLKGRIGTGGMGVVYLGVGRDGAPVAIKMIRPELAGDEEFRARFTREAVAASRVESPFTALVADADLDCTQPWMATEYVPGPSLQSRVTTAGPLRLRELVEVGAGIASGLAAIHGAGLVHRDVKPSNIILSAGGPRIIDFGIAYMQEATTLTRTEMMIGSPGFLSPEQVRGAKVTPASDVFSLGATLVHAAAGRSPFGSGPAEALLYRVVHENADLSGVPAPLTRLLQSCLAKSPRTRPNADDVLAGLRALEQRRAAAVTAGGSAQTTGGRNGRATPARSAPAKAPQRSGNGRRRGRAFIGRLVIFAVAFGIAALVITVVPKVFGATPHRVPAGAVTSTRTPRAAPRSPGTPPTVLTNGTPAIATAPQSTDMPPPSAAPRPSSAPPSSAPPTSGDPAAQGAGPGNAQASALGTVDWADLAGYRDYSVGGTPLRLAHGSGTSGDQPVALTAEVPITLGGAPAMVVVLTKQGTATLPAAYNLVHVFGLAAGQPTLLGGAASAMDPTATTRWRMEGSTLVREQDAAAAEGPTTPLITRYTIDSDGSVTELGTAAP